MKECICLLLGSLLAAGVEGCIPIAYPLATPADTTWYAEFSGRWISGTDPDEADEVDESAEYSWVSFIPGYDGMYFDSDSAAYSIHPVRLGGRWFAECREVSAKAETLTYEHGERSTYDWVARVEVMPDSLKVGLLAEDKLVAFERTHPGSIRLGQLTKERGHYVAASTEEMRGFLERYGGVDSLFAELMTFSRQKGRSAAPVAGDRRRP
jgi:hypothetical protein